jgi:hypothetical protein
MRVGRGAVMPPDNPPAHTHVRTYRCARRISRVDARVRACRYARRSAAERLMLTPCFFFSSFFLNESSSSASSYSSHLSLTHTRASQFRRAAEPRLHPLLAHLVTHIRKVNCTHARAHTHTRTHAHILQDHRAVKRLIRAVQGVTAAAAELDVPPPPGGAGPGRGRGDLDELE